MNGERPEHSVLSSLWLRWVAGTLLIFTAALALAGAVVGAMRGLSLIHI